MWNCKCSCGAFTTVRGQSLKSGNTNSCGCIKSLGEQKIAKMLFDANIPYIREFIFSDFKPYRFDFFVDNKYVIEYDGKQHFENCSWGGSEYLLEDNQKRDNLKNCYCFQKNIPIIRIPYTHFNDLTIKDLLIETSDFILKNI